MTVKELIEKLNNFDENKEVIIRFAVSNNDDIGYILEPKIVDEYVVGIAIYSIYNDSEEDCNFIGQKNLTKLWEIDLKNYIPKSKIEEKIEGMDRNISSVRYDLAENYIYSKKILQELLESE